MKRAILYLLLIISIVAIADTRTTRNRLKPSDVPSVDSITATELTDTLNAVSPDSILAEGYDKSLRSTRESFRVTNNCSKRLISIDVVAVYRDMEGTMLHSRRLKLDCQIAPGETRQLDFRAWDMQQRFYHHSTRITPRSRKAIPYQVSLFIKNPVFAQ